MYIESLQLLVLKVLGIAIATAAILVPYSKTNPVPAIHFWAQFYNIDESELYDTLKCESGFDELTQSFAYKDGVRENSWGVAQINLDMWPQITKQQAQDPNFALPFIARHIADGEGHLWTCYPHGFLPNGKRALY